MNAKELKQLAKDNEAANVDNLFEIIASFSYELGESQSGLGIIGPNSKSIKLPRGTKLVISDKAMNKKARKLTKIWDVREIF